jgi:hypothetical protein
MYERRVLWGSLSAPLDDGLSLHASRVCIAYPDRVGILLPWIHLNLPVQKPGLGLLVIEIAVHGGV